MVYKFNNKGFANYTYAELLSTDEWKSKRFEILEQDDFKCGKCFRHATEVFSNYGKYFAIGSDQPVMINNRLLLKPQIYYYDEPAFLHIHHKFYVLSRLPWEYKREDLLTLCNSCHLTLHDTTQVPVYFDENMVLLENLTDCPRCDGYGYINDYSHVQDGICFRCNGSKFLQVSEHIF